MRRSICFLALIGCLAVMALPALAGERFACVAFHDVVDYPGDLDDDAVTTDRLIGFFEWLRANDWTVISLDDLEAARLGMKPLPERAILLTFDDGYRSLYTRVFPLLLAYDFPAVCLLTGAWMDAPMDGTVRYDDREVPRGKFLSWDEAREMQHSGLVEFGSHSYDLHRGVLANPQGNQLAAAWTRIYRPGRGYESAAEFRHRITRDLEKSCAQLTRELGEKPRAIAWPFGRYNGTDMEVAKAHGFTFAFTLDPEPSDPARPLAIARYLPTDDPNLSTLVSNIRFENGLPAARRLVALDPADLWTGDDAGTNERLGKTIERLRKLGATGIVIDAAVTGADGRLEAAWFPTTQLPVRADILSRIAWQCQTRGGTTAYVRLPSGAALRTLGDPVKVDALFRDLGDFVPVSGMFIDDAPGLALLGGGKGSSGMPWEVRAVRDAVDERSLSPADAMALRAFRDVEFERPAMRLIVVADADPPPTPGAIADITLVPIAPTPRAVERLTRRLGAAGWLAPDMSRRGGLWFRSDRPPAASALVAATRIFQIQGGTVLGWSADDPVNDRPKAKDVAPTVSASTFPVRF